MKTILIIDDERPTLDMLSLLMSAYGYETYLAEDGEQGIEVFREKNPGIVLTDIKMPGMDGLEVLRAIKELNPHTEVIVVTGHGDMDLAIQALNLNATDFINKPVQRDALEAALNRAEERLDQGVHRGNQVVVRQRGDVAIMEVHGNVTSRTEPFLYEAFNTVLEDGNKKLILLFNQQTTINGAGIAVLTQLVLKGSEQGRQVAVAGLSDNFCKVFEVVGITKYATMYVSEDKAMKGLSK